MNPRRKKKLLPLLVVAAIGFVGAYGGAKAITKSRTLPSASTATKSYSPEIIARGEYIAHTADCAACHTAPNAPKYAGGLAMQTPIGAIYSTNITPDKETGIGTYTLAEFSTAVKHGVRQDGAPLYPAMPYPSYTIMPDEDIEALYAYFMKEVKPVKFANADSTIPPVLNWRWPVAYWQFLFSPEREFTPETDKDALYNHGAYLVEGPGHCGACHTPRGIAYQEKAYSMKDGNDFLSGAIIDGWRAKSLRGEARGLQSWSQEEIQTFLKTGRTDKVSAFGAMTDVINHSTQYFTDHDIESIAYYLKSLSPAPGKEITLPKKEDTTTAALLAGKDKSKGAILYMDNCVTCHRVDGKGVARVIPALADNSAIFARNAQSIIQITLDGGKMPETPADIMAFTMPGFSHLGDEDIAEVINFIRNSWGNQAPNVDPSDVARTRHFLKTKSPHIVYDANAQGGRHE